MRVALAPNPFSKETTIVVEMLGGARVETHVFDVAGRMVRTLRSGYLRAGRHEIGWDGRDDRGCPVASGVYFVRLSSPNQSIVKKTLVVK